MATFTIFIIASAGAYLLGSIPWGLILVRFYCGVDIRNQGSGNVGASNVRRLAGNKLGLVTLVLDAAKGALPTWISLSLSNSLSPEWHSLFMGIVALAAVCGHLFPAFLGFKPSGKGVATAAGAYIVLAPLAFLAALLIFVILVKASKRVSPGSMAATGVLPIAVWLFYGNPILTATTCIITALILYRHKDNIKRLLAGREPRLDR